MMNGTHRRTILRVAAAATLLGLASGCLVKEARHTCYLSPDGELSWTVLESDVRSDHQDPAERAAEEAAYLEQARKDKHLAGRALDDLGPRRLETVVLREHRPFTVHTTARFRDVSRVVQRGLRELDVRGDAWLEYGDGWSRLRIEMRADDMREWEDDEELPDLLALLLDADRFEIRLTEGEFVEARGFDIRDKGRVVVPEKIDLEELPDDTLVLSLTWAAEQDS